MQKLTVKNFKGIASREVELLLEGKSVVICGENGAGKSSIYDAIKWCFYHNNEYASIPASTRHDQIEGKRLEIRTRYFNRKNQPLQPFVIKINDQDYETFDDSGFLVSMLSSKCLDKVNKISLEYIVSKCELPQIHMDTLSIKDIRFVKEYVNNALENIFFERISIEIAESGEHICTIHDEERNLTVDSDLDLYINEAKIHLIIILIALTLSHLNRTECAHKVLVIDDIISSFDNANRLLFANFLIEEFKSENIQMVFLTHNVGFFNLLHHVINIQEESVKNKWKYYHLYESEGITKYYPHEDSKTCDELLSSINNIDEHNAAAMDTIGNQCRRKLEELVHKYAELLMLGASEESKSLIKYLSEDVFYWKNKESGIYSMVREIASLVKNVHDKAALVTKIEKCHKDYKVENKFLKIVLKQLLLCQKVILHPMSHIGGETVNYTKKELEVSICLMKQLEKDISRLTAYEEVTRV